MDIQFVEKTSHESYTFSYDGKEYIHILKMYECFQMFNNIPNEKLSNSTFITDDSLNRFIDNVIIAFRLNGNRQIHFLETIYCLLVPHNFEVLYNKLDVLRHTYNINDSIISMLLGRVIKVHGCIDDKLVLYFTKLDVNQINPDTFNFVSKRIPLILLKHISNHSICK